MSQGTRSMFMTAATLAVVTIVADFLRVREFGPLSDDWFLVGQVGWFADADPFTTAHDLFFWSWNARPLRGVGLLLLAAGHALGGLVGMHAVMAATLVVTATLFARLTARRLGDEAGLAAGLLLVLHPADTTHAWSASLNGKLGLLVAVLACLAFANRRNLLAASLCVVALLTYELSVLVFALAPWFRDGGSRRALAEAARTGLMAAIPYGLWRIFVFRRSDAALHEKFEAYASSVDDPEPALRTVLEAVPTFVWRWPGKAVRTLAERGLPDGAIAAFLCLSVTVLIVALAARRGALLSSSPSRSEVGRALLWGTIGVLSGCVLAVFVAPTLALGHESRYNLGAIPGAALLGTAVLAAIRLVAGRAGVIVMRTLVIAITVVLTTFRLHVQDDYVAAARYQRRVLSEFVEGVPDVHPHTVVVIRRTAAGWDRPMETAVQPFVLGFDFEMTSALRALYDASVLGCVIETEEDTRRSDVGPVGQAVNAARRFHDVLIYDADVKTGAWIEPRLRPGSILAPRGPALEYVLRP